MSAKHHVCLSLLSTCQQRSRDILVCCDGRALDTEAFINRVSEVSQGLSACGVRPGDVVLLAGWNTDHMLASLLGCMDAGAIATPVNHRWSAPELMLAMQLTQPALAIVDQHCHELVQQACNSLPAAMRLANVSMEHFHAPCGLPEPGGSAVCSTHVPEATCGPSRDPATGLQLLTAPGGTCLLCFTSGTTGQPKAVALTHASLNHASLAKLAAVGYRQTDTYLHLAPLFHVGAISSALACLMAGTVHVLLPRFNPHHALHLMQEHGVTAFIAVPTIMQDLVRAAASPAAASCPPSCVASRPTYPPTPSPTPPTTPMLTVRLVLLGAGATTPQLQAELFRVFPAARVMSAYGMTEASSSITFLSITSPCKHGQVHSVQPCSYAHQPSQAQPHDGTAHHHHQLQGQLITNSPNQEQQQQHQQHHRCKVEQQQQQQQRLPASAPNVKGIHPANTACKQLPVNLSGAVRVGWPSPGVAVRIYPFPDVTLPDSSSGSSTTANSQGVDRCGSSSSSQGAGRMVAAAAPWQEGEVWTRSAQVMQCYWGDSQATRQVLTPSGWLRTGDVGFLDPTGCLWLRGRAKDMIKTGGENVFAAEVEAALMSHPSVRAAAVVGIPDARLGETVAALLVLQPGWQWQGHTAGLAGAAATEELEEAMSSRHVINSLDVQDHCRNVVQLSPYKLPRVIVALPPNVELPCTTSGKVMKAPVKAAVLAARANPLSKL